MNKQKWEKVRDRIEYVFQQIFGDKAPTIKLLPFFEEEGNCDCEIEIENKLSIYLPHGVYSTSHDPFLRPWQLGAIWSDPGTYWVPPDGGVDEIGEPHNDLDRCIEEAIKIWAHIKISELFDNEYEEKLYQDWQVKNKDAEEYFTECSPEMVSKSWVLSQLAGMSFPKIGGAHEYMKKLCAKLVEE